MRLVTWNVNSIRVRLEQVLELLRKHEPDVLCLQELKVAEKDFPEDELAEAGYRGVVAAQRTYNGVALLARDSLDSAGTGFEDGDEEDGQARIARADVGGVRVACLYCPNGENVDSPKYAYKLAWYERLRRVFDAQEDAARPTLVAGDFNVAPAEIDVYNPRRFDGKVLCSEKERAAFSDLLDWGLVDCFRKLHPEKVAYTWWDYRFDMFSKRKGLRIDHVLASEPMAERLKACFVDEEIRSLDRPSDHAPVVCDFDG